MYAQIAVNYTVTFVRTNCREIRCDICTHITLRSKLCDRLRNTPIQPHITFTHNHFHDTLLTICAPTPAADAAAPIGKAVATPLVRDKGGTALH
jgi:hypothetical protein